MRILVPLIAVTLAGHAVTGQARKQLEIGGVIVWWELERLPWIVMFLLTMTLMRCWGSGQEWVFEPVHLRVRLIGFREEI
ncbi:hypothetical protein [Yoonia sp. MH D7]